MSNFLLFAREKGKGDWLQCTAGMIDVWERKEGEGMMEFESFATQHFNRLSKEKAILEF